MFRKSWFKTLKRWEPNKVYQFILLLERFNNDEQLNIPEDILDFWEQVEPLLLNDRIKYDERVERNKTNGKNGGRPPKLDKTQENPQEPNQTQNNRVGFLETQQNPKNPKDKDKDKDKEKDKDKDNEKNGGFEKLLQVFPNTKVRNEHECLSLWDKLSQDDKKKVIKHSVVYVREMVKKGEEQYIKNLQSYLSDRYWEGNNKSQPKQKTNSRSNRGFEDYQFITWFANQVSKSYQEAKKILYIEFEDEEFNIAKEDYKELKKQLGLP